MVATVLRVCAVQLKVFGPSIPCTPSRSGAESAPSTSSPAAPREGRVTSASTITTTGTVRACVGGALLPRDPAGPELVGVGAGRARYVDQRLRPRLQRLGQWRILRPGALGRPAFRFAPTPGRARPAAPAGRVAARGKAGGGPVADGRTLDLVIVMRIHSGVCVL